jgi:signal transduction histidine kinase
MSFVKNDRKIRRINLRIAGLFAALFALISLLLLGGVYYTVKTSLRDQELTFIRHKLLGYWAATQTRDIEDFLENLDGGSFGLEGTPFFMRVSDTENRTIFFMFPQGWKDFFPDNLESRLRDPERTLTVRSPNHDYTLEAAGVPLGGEYFLQVGISTEQSRKMLALVVRNFSLLFVPLLFLSLLVGAFLTAGTLKPIGELAEAAGRIISTGNLKERIEESAARDELRDLVGLFNRMLERIESLVRGMKGTLDTVAHDLRTPLTRFRGIAELALRGPENIERFREALEEGLEESEGILSQLDAVMDLSEAETGTLKLDLAFVDLSGIVKDLVEMYSFVAEDRGITVAFSGPETVEARIDAARFRRAAGNLLDNAVKYSPDNKRVAVELAPLPGTAEVPGGVRLTVRDEGPGILDEDLPHIWDRLYRGKEARKKPGLGLGLSIVKAVAEAHGGRAEVRTEPGRGTVFSIILPDCRAF